MNVADLLDLTGKVALVTGASAGIGAGIARRLAEAGAAVAVHYRGGRGEAEALVARIGDAGGKAIAVHAELTDPAAVRAAFAEVEIRSVRSTSSSTTPPARPIRRSRTWVRRNGAA